MWPFLKHTQCRPCCNKFHMCLQHFKHGIWHGHMRTEYCTENFEVVVNHLLRDIFWSSWFWQSRVERVRILPLRFAPAENWDAQGRFHQLFYHNTRCWAEGQLDLLPLPGLCLQKSSSENYLLIIWRKLSILFLDKILSLATLTLTHCFAYQLFLAGQMSMLPSDKMRSKYTQVKGRSRQQQVKQ